MLRTLSIALLITLCLLEYRFWCGGDSILQARKLKIALREQNKELELLKTRNQHIADKINNLKKYPAAIEEQARNELGMVKQGEQYYQVVEPIQ